LPHRQAPLLLSYFRERPARGAALSEREGIEDDGLDDEEGLALAAPGPLAIELSADEADGRLDKALAAKAPELSRARLQALMADGRVSRDGARADDPAARALPGVYLVDVPPPVPAIPQAEPIPLVVLYEDPHLIVIDKPAGMAVHPAPGSWTGTLVNALLAHCGESLSGIGGVARPGIVHRLDKDTAGVMVAAKTDVAHRGLAELFARHDLERVYLAFTRGAPKRAGGTIRTQIGRSSRDRKKMAVLPRGGREAVTHYKVERHFGSEARPLAARIACRLETGRTHQIRVHLAHLGAPCLGDPLYGAGAPAPAVRAAVAEAGLARQALHAAVLGFVHPVSGKSLRFESPLPQDLVRLEAGLQLL
jgi:23S rRNA pseudouridine1911/1915/1917 synthase